MLLLYIMIVLDLQGHEISEHLYMFPFTFGVILRLYFTC